MSNTQKLLAAIVATMFIFAACLAVEEASIKSAPIAEQIKATKSSKQKQKEAFRRVGVNESVAYALDNPKYMRAVIQVFRKQPEQLKPFEPMMQRKARDVIRYQSSIMKDELESVGELAKPIKFTPTGTRWNRPNGLKYVEVKIKGKRAFIPWTTYLPHLAKDKTYTLQLSLQSKDLWVEDSAIGYGKFPTYGYALYGNTPQMIKHYEEALVKVKKGYRYTNAVNKVKHYTDALESGEFTDLLKLSIFK